MDFSIIIGLLGGVVLIVLGILNGGMLKDFFDLGSIFITIGGTVAALVMSVSFKNIIMFPKHVKVLLRKNKYSLDEYIDTIVELAQEARRKGLLALEEKINNIEIEDEFLKGCVMMIVDGVDSGKVRAQIENELSGIEYRHQKAWSIYDKGGALAPAFGMIGTLIGLINMLASLDVTEGAEKLGIGMSTALVTTFYGTILANLFFIPISNKLRTKHEEEIYCKELVMEGVLSIQAGENPKYIKEKLKTFMSYSERNDEDQKSKISSINKARKSKSA